VLGIACLLVDVLRQSNVAFFNLRNPLIDLRVTPRRLGTDLRNLIVDACLAPGLVEARN
jgi:hypothetical protein